MTKLNKIAGYRASINKTRPQMAKILNISTTAYRNKEIGLTPFKDSEKVLLVQFFKDNGIDTNIEDLFF
ncbi:hypothetical protein HZY83_02455 [Gemella sp. GH3]|uniref:hypothetical protein n=1 Tax=unclassified Gemella TaxID=2624949 RepID=UPI0015CF87D5|nr:MULTISPECIES: hypothetical protein [unclassified Gemella]MBF0713548.1 hypothetical protein [Gemella sp. GH3.1]NYS50500.1 hypothetical protein [Gemella sp. GH3]